MKGGAPASLRRLLIKKSAVLQPKAHFSTFVARWPRACVTIDPLVKRKYQLANPRTSGLTEGSSNDPAMSADGMTFGRAIAKARKELGLSQKELAARVMKEEGGGSISPQYLNDIEHDWPDPIGWSGFNLSS